MTDAPSRPYPETAEDNPTVNNFKAEIGDIFCAVVNGVNGVISSGCGAYNIERNNDGSINLSKSAAALITGLLQARAVAQCAWMPIETAPKDRTRILLFQAGRGAFEGWWHTAWPSPEAYWMDDADSEPQPTHWRPTLPLPSTPRRTPFGCDPEKCTYPDCTCSVAPVQCGGAAE
jgi:hypothetical protein